jgi:hypothetical protein
MIRAWLADNLRRSSTPRPRATTPAERSTCWPTSHHFEDLATLNAQVDAERQQPPTSPVPTWRSRV